MFFGVLGTLLYSLGTIFWKKSLEYQCKPNLFNLFGFFGPIFIGGYIILSKNYDFSGWNIYIFFVLIFISITAFIASKMEKYAYQNEKISVLSPYENLNKIITTVLAFVLFGGVSGLSFFFTLLGGCVFILFTIDFSNLKSFRISKTIKIFAFQQCLVSINMLVIGYILKYISTTGYYFMSNLLGFVLLLIVIKFKNEFTSVENLHKEFYKNSLSSSVLIGFSDLISIFLIANVGVSLTILFSYLYVGLTLVLSYIFLRDIPSKKSILLTIILSILVGLGWYFE